MTNKYQEALDYLDRITLTKRNDGLEIHEEQVKTLQELIDRYTKISYPKFVPCKCGHNRRNCYVSANKGWKYRITTYECKKCGAKVSTQGGEAQAIRHWNEVMTNE